MRAEVTWDADASSYDPSVTTEQVFEVDGTVTLPGGVVNPNGVSLDITIHVTVNAASAVPPEESEEDDEDEDEEDDDDTGIPAVPPDRKPDRPIIAGFRITPTVDQNGHAIVTVTEKSVADAIAKALANAKAQGKTTFAGTHLIILLCKVNVTFAEYRASRVSHTGFFQRSQPLPSCQL